MTLNLLILKSPQITNKIRNRWLLGESVNGGDIGDYRSGLYRSFKININPSGRGKVDLTLTGALGKGLTIKKASSKSIEIFSKDDKFFSIATKYGFEEFNLTDKEWVEISEEIVYIIASRVISKIYS